MTPNADNYTLGKGVIYFNRKDMATGEYTGERDLGNAPEFSFNIALEKLEHFSSRGGLKAKDKEIISQITPGITFTLDEIDAANLALLTLADVEEVVQAGANITLEEHVAHLGMRVNLAERGISAVVVSDDNVGTITYVAGAEGVGNYQIVESLSDDKIGRIYINKDQSGAANPMTDGQDIFVDYTSAAVTYTKIKAFAQTQVEGELRFVSDNPVGNQMELEIWRCSLTPSGDTAMIGDDWSTLGFTGEILKDAVRNPDSPYMNILMV